MNAATKVRATDTLRIHFTTVGHIYDVIESDDECYKIHDDRGRDNWVPFRYFEVVASENEENSDKSK